VVSAHADNLTPRARENGRHFLPFWSSLKWPEFLESMRPELVELTAIR
jgi:hypothetical protein